MLKEMASASSIVLETFAEASQVLGYDLWALVQDGPETALNATEKTQPAMLAAGVSLWRIWRENEGALPAIMAGHSLGEYTALVCAGALDYRDAVALVADRGKYMQQAVPAGTGAMAAILGLSDQETVEACEVAADGEIVACANYNSPGQVVIAGHTQAVNRAVEEAKKRGAKRAVVLPVSVPSHSALMKPAADRLFERLHGLKIKPPTIPVLHNVDVSVRERPEEIIEALVTQLYMPVRWVEIVEKLARERINLVIECGPGKVLAGLGKRIDRNLDFSAIHDPQSLNAALEHASVAQI
jgi:[acyl-carrier-protein] S-malonyltransferase